MTQSSQILGVFYLLFWKPIGADKVENKSQLAKRNHKPRVTPCLLDPHIMEHTPRNFLTWAAVRAVMRLATALFLTVTLINP